MTTIRWRRAALLCVAAGLAGACRTETPQQQLVDTGAAEGRLADSADTRTSMVRVINAVPGANGVEISAEANALFSGVDYKSVTPYAELQGDVTGFRLRNDGRDTMLATNGAIAADGSRYTIVAIDGPDGGMGLRVLHDELVPDTGKTRVRVVHGIRGESDLDVLLGDGDPLFEAVSFGAEAGYRQIDPMKGMLVLRATDSGRQLLRKEMKLVAGHSYTIVVAGTTSANGSVRRVDAIVVDDQAIPRQP